MGVAHETMPCSDDMCAIASFICRPLGLGAPLLRARSQRKKERKKQRERKKERKKERKSLSRSHLPAARPVTSQYLLCRPCKVAVHFYHGGGGQNQSVAKGLKLCLCAEESRQRQTWSRKSRRLCRRAVHRAVVEALRLRLAHVRLQRRPPFGRVGIAADQVGR